MFVSGNYTACTKTLLFIINILIKILNTTKYGVTPNTNGVS